MFVIVISKKDTASVNIGERLLEHSGWVFQKDIKFESDQVYTFSDLAVMVTINPYHLYYDNIDLHVQEDLAKQGLPVVPAVVIFASKHQSASGMKTLSVHPVGNYGKAEYGGKSQELVPAAPHIMTMAYRILREQAIENNLSHSVTFEATHHGPYLETPSFFIEIGSDASAWGDKDAADVIAKTIILILESDLESQCLGFPVAIGVGGGHYTPHHTDLARNKKVSFGHIIPSYALPGISDRMLLRALERTPNAELVHFHKKALKKDQYNKLKSMYEEHGCRIVTSDDLEDIQ